MGSFEQLLCLGTRRGPLIISVPADIAGQSKHAADWLDGRKEQGPCLVLARAKRQMEELEVDWADAFAVPETESVTVPRQKKKRTEEPAAGNGEGLVVGEGVGCGVGARGQAGELRHSLLRHCQRECEERL